MAFGTESQFHVLAVDDSRLDRKLIERLLKTSSYHVTAVDSGRKALEFLGVQEDETCSPSSQQDITVSLIITDYSMPGMTGYDLLKKIKESSVLKDIPVVIMSSENVPSRINRCLEEGAEEFLLKPVQLSDMKKLRPHILRSKEQDADQFHHHQHQKNQQQTTEPQTAEQLQQQQCLNSSTCKKRKAMDGGLSAERTRQRPSSSYGLFTIV